MVQGAEPMAAQRRFSLLLSPAGIVVGHHVVVVAVAGGLLAFPFLGILLRPFSDLVKGKDRHFIADTTRQFG
jgi:hypothetical protein